MESVEIGEYVLACNTDAMNRAWIIQQNLPDAEDFYEEGVVTWTEGSVANVQFPNGDILKNGKISEFQSITNE